MAVWGGRGGGSLAVVRGHGVHPAVEQDVGHQRRLRAQHGRLGDGAHAAVVVPHPLLVGRVVGVCDVVALRRLLAAVVDDGEQPVALLARRHLGAHVRQQLCRSKRVILTTSATEINEGNQRPDINRYDHTGVEHAMPGMANHTNISLHHAIFKAKVLADITLNFKAHILRYYE